MVLLLNQGPALAVALLSEPIDRVVPLIPFTEMELLCSHKLLHLLEFGLVVLLRLVRTRDYLIV